MRMLALLLSVVLALFALVPSAAFAGTSPTYRAGSTGHDVSYPNCGTAVDRASFGVVGVNGGISFSQNPCLAQEASWFVGRASLYANTGYPGAVSPRARAHMTWPRPCRASDLDCLAYDYGYSAGTYSVRVANSQGLSPAMWWLDVETSNSWTADPIQNRSALQGFHDALRRTGVPVGVYSTTAQWGAITGGWKNGWPTWGATVVRTARQAASFCTGHRFTGGPTYLIQYAGKADLNYACPR